MQTVENNSFVIECAAFCSFTNDVCAKLLKMFMLACFQYMISHKTRGAAGVSSPFLSPSSFALCGKLSFTVRELDVVFV
jgi:hypothetical protein